MKTTELSGAALDWAVAKCEWAPQTFEIATTAEIIKGCHYSTNWAATGPIIEREGISIIRLEDDSIADEKGYEQGVYAPRWAAVVGDKHDRSLIFSSYGGVSGEGYEVDSEAVIGSTPLEAAMRAYVVKRFGSEIEVPGELK